MSEEHNEMYERSFEGPKPKLKGKFSLVIIISAVAVCFAIAAGLYLLWPEDKPSDSIVMRQITAQVPEQDPVSKEDLLPLTANMQEGSIKEDALSSGDLIAEVQEISPEDSVNQEYGSIDLSDSEMIQEISDEDSAIQEQPPISEINNVKSDTAVHADEVDAAADELKEVTISEKSLPAAETKQDDIIKQEPVPSTEIKNSDLEKTAGYMVQVGSFKTISRANIIKEKLEKKGFNAFIITASIPELGTRYRVRVGGYETRSNADNAAKKFKEMGMPTLIVSPAK